MSVWTLFELLLTSAVICKQHFCTKMRFRNIFKTKALLFQCKRFCLQIAAEVGKSSENVQTDRVRSFLGKNTHSSLKYVLLLDHHKQDFFENLQYVKHMRTKSVLLSFSQKKFIGQKLAPKLSQLYSYLGPYLDIPDFLDLFYYFQDL